MDSALLVARLLLAAVFLVSALAKLADRPGSRQAIIDFGVPARLASPLGVALPGAELAVALALLPTRTAWWGALGALALLLTFVAGIAVNMAKGRAPDCHCFGQLHSEPVGWPTLARNGALALVAGFVLWRGNGSAGTSAVAWAGDLTGGAQVALFIAAVALVLAGIEGWFLLNLLGQNGRLLVRVEALEAGTPAGSPAVAPTAVPGLGLPVGSPAPAFALAGLYGEILTLDALRAAGKPTLLVFSDPHCGPCNALLPDLGRWQREHAGRLILALVSRGTPDENRNKATEHQLAGVLLQQDREVANAYLAAGTPTAVLVNPDGTIASPLALGADAITALVARAVGMVPVPLVAVNGNGNAGQGAPPTAVPPPSRIGQPAPPLTLPDLGGKRVSLGAMRGRDTLVLFWNPGCGFCAQMLDDLKAWETGAPQGAPQLLVVSTGEAETNRAMGIKGTVVLDPSFATGSAFGATGTPSAVLLDAKGMIASEIAVGAPAVLALANGGAARAGTV